jgi:hypothetical protein
MLKKRFTLIPSHIVLAGQFTYPPGRAKSNQLAIN